MRCPAPQPRDNDFGAMTSMIDVVFLLLIFFVVTASDSLEELLLPTKLAASGAVESSIAPPAENPLTIDVWLKLSVSPVRGQIVVDMNGTEYRNLPELKGQLRALAELGPENPVILDVAPDVSLGALVEIYDTCQAAGFESVNFATKSRD